MRTSLLTYVIVWTAIIGLVGSLINAAIWLLLSALLLWLFWEDLT